MKKEVKIKAFSLRKEQKSYSEISRILGVSKGTLTHWFKNEPWSEEIKKNLGVTHSLAHPKKQAAIKKALQEHWVRQYEVYRSRARKEFEKLKKNQTFLAGVMLYWGEGDKNPQYSKVKLANSDPLMIRLFFVFLKDVLCVAPEKIHLSLLLYPDLEDKMQKNFWSRATGIPLSQFKNSIYIKGRHPKKRLSYGVCNIFVQSREVKEKMMIWIDLYQKMLTHEAMG